MPKPSSLRWHFHNFFSSHRFLSHPTRRTTFLKTSLEESQPALSCPLSLSCMSTICLRQRLLALSVCSASAKPIVVFVSPRLLPLFPFQEKSPLFLPALKDKWILRGNKKGKKNDKGIILTGRSRKKRQPPEDVPCRESAREEEYRSKQVNQGFALVWSVWRLALLPPPFPPYFSLLSHSLYPSLSSSSPSLARLPLPTCLPAAYKHSSFLSVGSSSCLLSGTCCCCRRRRRLRGPETRMWQPANLFVCFGSLVSLSTISVCVCGCLRAEIRWALTGIIIERVSSVFLITRAPPSHTNVHKLIFLLSLQFSYGTPKWCAFH